MRVSGNLKTCQWIDGDPLQPGWSFCEKPVRAVDEVWCEEHYERVYRVDPRVVNSVRPQKKAA